MLIFDRLFKMGLFFCFSLIFTASVFATETVKHLPPVEIISPEVLDFGVDDRVSNPSEESPVTITLNDEVEEEDVEPLGEVSGQNDVDVTQDEKSENKETDTTSEDKKNDEKKSDDKKSDDKKSDNKKQFEKNDSDKKSQTPEKKSNVKNGFAHVDIDLDGINHPLTQKYIKYYQESEGRKILVMALKNSVPYRPYIIQELEKKGLPSYLQYIPIVESHYKYTAVSKSGATGIWQFMTNSMAPLLKKGKGFDDRRDPWLSTDAAILKFRDNYRTFNDWAFAMAAYNCGAGALSKIVKANPQLSYWDMCDKGLLKVEPTHYVPKLLAIAEIVENAGYYGLTDIKEAADLIKGKSVEEFDYVTTKVMLTFAQLSDATGVSVEKIKQLNPSLLDNCTPLGSSYSLRLPKGKSVGIKDKLKKKGLALDCQYHTVVKGDTLWGISRKFDLTVEQLCKANGMTENSVLSIGKVLVIPIY